MNRTRLGPLGLTTVCAAVTLLATGFPRRRQHREGRLASVPIAEGYKADYQVDLWRAGAGVIYSFERSPVIAGPH